MTKADLRKHLRASRRDHAASLPDNMRALIFARPPAPLLDWLGPAEVIGLYSSMSDEAPTGGYLRFFFEQGRTLALPRFASRTAPMEFARITDPFEFSDCEEGPFGMLQPTAEADAVVPDAMFVPLLGFTDQGERLGQGGGHYDRWLERHPQTRAVGMSWDVQRCENLPMDEHDVRMNAIVTPTRLYGPF